VDHIKSRGIDLTLLGRCLSISWYSLGVNGNIEQDYDGRGKMHIFHKWGMWGEVELVPMVSVRHFAGVEISRTNYIQEIQTRKCLKCGEMQHRKVKKADND